MTKADIFDLAIDLTDVPEEKWNEFIGHGYRSCCYTTDHEKNGVILLFGFDTNENPQTFLIPHKSWVKYRVSYPTEEKDIYGHYVATKYFNNTSQRKKWVEAADGIFIVECLKPENELLHKLFDKYVLDADFNQQKLRKFFIDIETEISDQFMKPVDAQNRINMITIYDNYTEKFYTWSLDKAEIDFKEEPLCNMPKEMFEFFSFQNNEIRMMEHFLDWWQNNYPDVVSGWNSQAYDMPYIVRRIENILNKGAAGRLSPVGKYRITQVNHDNERANVEAEIEVDISGVFLADELVLYRDKFSVKPSLDGGYSLDNVGEAEGLGHKIHYDGTLKDLYEKDYQKFYEYNVRDVDLLKRIEDKCLLIPLARKIVGSGLCNYGTIYSSISYLIGSLISFAKINMDSVFQSYSGEKKENKSYEGAYVFPPVPGLYKGGIATVDFNSLYPSTIRALNLSPETYVGKIEPINYPDTDSPIDIDKIECEKFYLHPADSKDTKVKMIDKSQLLKLCETKCIFTRNNTLFLKHSIKQGVVSAWCKHFYNLRKSTKKSMQKLEMALYNKEVAEADIQKTKNEVQNLDNIQHAIKIMINSIYGMFGTSHSPIGNVDIAQTITRGGKFCNTEAAKYIKQWMMEKFKVGEDYITPVSGDTDSQFANITCITDYFIKKFNLPVKMREWPDEYKLKLWKFVDNFVEKNVNPFVQNLVATKCYSEHPEVLRYSLEYIGDCGIYEQKKRYGVHKVIAEGPELVDKLKFTGIELKRSNVPVAVKEFLRDIYENTLLNDWTNEDYRKYILDSYERFKKMDVNDIAFWKGWSSDKVESTGFLQGGKGMTGISKGCHFYNEMISHLKLGKKYDTLKIGDKVRFTYIEPNNIYGISSIAFSNVGWPKEFNEIFTIDYATMYEKLVRDPLKSFRIATQFDDVNPNEAMADDIFAL